MFNRSISFYLFALVAVGIPSIAFAQDEQVDPQDETLVLVEDTEGALDVAHSDELSWAQTRDIYTYQRKANRKDGRFSLALYTGVIPNNVFEQYIPVGLRFDYYFLEDVGVELSASYNIAVSTSLKKMLESDKSSLRRNTGINGLIVSDSQVLHTNVGIVWSPLYGKTSWYNKTIQYFDFYLFGGVGLALVETKENFGAKGKIAAKVEGAVGAGVNFFIDEHMHLRLDYRQFMFAKAQFIGGVAIPSEVSLAFGWMF